MVPLAIPTLDLHVFDFEISQLDMAKLRTLNEHWSALGQLQYLNG